MPKRTRTDAGFTARGDGQEQSAYNIAKEALRTANKLASDRELKLIDTSKADVTLDSGSYSFELFDPFQDTTSEGMVGDKVAIQKVKIRLKADPVTPISVAAGGAGHIRIIVFRINSQTLNATAYSAGAVLVNASLGSSIISFFKDKPEFSYSVLHDSVHHIQALTLSANTSSSTVETELFKEITISKPMSYTNDGTNSKGRLFMAVVHDLTDEEIQFRVNCRVRYYDA